MKLNIEICRYTKLRCAKMNSIMWIERLNVLLTDTLKVANKNKTHIKFD